MGPSVAKQLSAPALNFGQRVSVPWREMALGLLHLACVGLVLLLVAFVLLHHAYALWSGVDEHRDCPGNQVAKAS